MTTSVLKVTDGTTTLNFSIGDNMKLITYDAQVSTTGENVTERARVDFTGSAATNTATMRALNLLFEQARNYAKTQTGARVYIQYDPGSSGMAWRSRIFDAYIEQPDNLLGPWMYDTRWRMTIRWTRQPFWEGALTAVPLTNSSDTDATTGIAITNANDATAENWVSIDGVNDLIGDLPAPIKLQMENTKNGADATDEIWVFNNVKSTPADLDYILEGEDATGAGITDTGDATDSGDFFASIAWTATTETLIATWALSSGALEDMAGGRFKILARWDAAFPYTNVFLRLKLETTNGERFNGELRLIPDTRGLHELDTMRLPPNWVEGTTPEGINLNLYALRNTAGTHTIALDYLMLGAINGDNGWKRFVSTDTGAAGVAYQEFFTHDATEGYTYRTNSSSQTSREFSIYGGELFLIPGEVQKMYFLTCDYNGLAKVDQTWTVTLWYRPRRSAL